MTTELHVLVDSTGVTMLGEREWKTKKHGAGYRRQWSKVHFGDEASMLEIRVIKVTDNATGDKPILPCRLDQIHGDKTVTSVSGEGACDTKGCHEAIAQSGKQAIIYSQERQTIRGPASWCRSPRCYPGGDAPAWQENLEILERQLPEQLG